MNRFNVGDTVRIRQWDDMEKEFGRTSGGNIDCFSVFTTEMRPLCGKQFTITEIPGLVVLGHGTRWAISTDMIEPVYYGDRQTFNDDTSAVDNYLAEFIKH